jgi:ABC-2 type transport system ATP-binding protein
MDEAAHLCDRVAIIDHGKVVALDSPDGLVATLGARVKLELQPAPANLSEIVGAVDGVVGVERTDHGVVVWLRDDAVALDLAQALVASGHSGGDRRIAPTGLEDVFLRMTGRELRD